MRDVSRLAGLGTTYLSLLESNLRPDPRASTLVAVARVYGVTIDWLVCGTQPAFRGRPRVDPEATQHEDRARALVRAAVAAQRAANDNAASGAGRAA